MLATAARSVSLPALKRQLPLQTMLQRLTSPSVQAAANVLRFAPQSAPEGSADLYENQ
jgi:hypothetical protein